MNGILHLNDFIKEPEGLYHTLLNTISWDESMVARKTVSFGKAYNYSQMSYPDSPLSIRTGSAVGAVE